MDIIADEILLTDVLPRLPVKELLALCNTNNRFNQLCQNDGLWLIKSKADFPDVEKDINETWRNFYLSRVVKDIDVFYEGDRSRARIYLDDIEDSLASFAGDYRDHLIVLVDNRLLPIMTFCTNNNYITSFSNEQARVIVIIRLDLYKRELKPLCGKIRVSNKQRQNDEAYEELIKEIRFGINKKYPIGFETSDNLFIGKPYNYINNIPYHRRCDDMGYVELMNIMRKIGFIKDQDDLTKYSLHYDGKDLCKLIYDWLADNNLIFQGYID